MRGVIPDNFKVSRELKGYEIADYVVILSKHVKGSFLERGYPEEKLFMNPYGANLKSFHFISGVEKDYDAIMVGVWSIQKGCDILAKAFEGTDISLLHIVQIGDLPFPVSDNFYHIDHVDNLELINYYNRAKVFVLASRQEGMALVLLEALACGLSVVCTEFSGGETIQESMKDKSRITVVRTDAEVLRKAVLEAVDRVDDGVYLPFKGEKKFSWKVYGERYAKFIDSILRNKTTKQKNKREKVKINILTTSRFHVIDLARELETQGFDVRLYSIVSKKRIMQFGVQARSVSNAWLLTAPFVALNLATLKAFPNNNLSRNMQTLAVDWIFGHVMRRCDVLIAMSGSFLKSLKIARAEKIRKTDNNEVINQ